MGHILIFLHKIVGFKLVAILLSVGMVVMVFQISSAFKVHALNVHAEIKASPPGIARIIDRTGNPPSGIVNPQGQQPPFPTSGTDPTTSGTGLPGEPPGSPTPPGDNGNNGPEGTSARGQGQSQTMPLPPGLSNLLGGGGGGGPPGLFSPQQSTPLSPTALIINTEIDFELMFPGETKTGNFTVHLSDTQWDNPPGGPWGPFTGVDYKIFLNAGGSSTANMTPYLTVYLSPTEVAAGETDNVTFATVNTTDTSDCWWVTFEAPDEPPAFGDYSANITVEVTATK